MTKGQVFSEPAPAAEICIADDCDKPVVIKKRQLCRKHYTQAWHAGEFGQLATRHIVRNVDTDAGEGDCSECGPAVPVMVKADLAQCKTRARYSRLRMLYGLEPTQVEAMLEAAGHACEICRTPFGTTWVEQVRFDHDHACCPGKIRCGGKCLRGVLCHGCNVALGYLRDNPTILRSAIAYLEREIPVF